jgi:hypothetical protein
MATFYVGQRVRVVGADVSKFLIGRETRVTGQLTLGRGKNDTSFYGYPTDLRNWCDCVFIARPEFLEPILPDGHRACDDDFKRDLDKLLERQGLAA